MSAYRFAFGTKFSKGEIDRKFYDFSVWEISEFLSAIVEKYDNKKYYFTGRKKVNLGTVQYLVRSGNGANSVLYHGNRFAKLSSHMNIQNIRNMFAILAYGKIPMRIHGKKYLVDYDNGSDVRDMATDMYTVEQSTFLKLLNSGEWKTCKDNLNFVLIS